jgi:hypothetical protein
MTRQINRYDVVGKGVVVRPREGIGLHPDLGDMPTVGRYWRYAYYRIFRRHVPTRVEATVDAIVPRFSVVAHRMFVGTSKYPLHLWVAIQLEACSALPASRVYPNILAGGGAVRRAVASITYTRRTGKSADLRVLRHVPAYLEARTASAAASDGEDIPRPPGLWQPQERAWFTRYLSSLSDASRAVTKRSHRTDKVSIVLPLQLGAVWSPER